jgi:hypothetical protein
LNVLVTAVSTGVSCHGTWDTTVAPAYLLTGGLDQVHVFILVPLNVIVFHD